MSTVLVAVLVVLSAAAVSCGADTTTVKKTVRVTGPSGASEESAAEQLPCNKQQARKVAAKGRFADESRAIGLVPAHQPILGAQLIGCRDLTSDGSEEMVVQVPGPTGGAPFPWAIFRREAGQWAPALMRTAVLAWRVKIEGEEIRERSPVFAEGYASCCPSGWRQGAIRWRGGEFVYQPLNGTKNRSITLRGDEAESIGGFDLQSGSLPEAIAAFGPPTATAHSRGGNVCPADWDDLGLRIGFANLGTANPCGPEGRVSSAHVTGLEAEQAGWRTEAGATVGASHEALRGLYPQMKVEELAIPPSEELKGRPFTLVERRSIINGTHPRTPTLSARLVGGMVVGFDLSVGAAGE